MGYDYPLDESWGTQEIIDVVNFFTLVEKAHESQVDRTEMIALYKRFKEIVPSKSEEKKLFAAFEKASGYSSYKVIKKAKDSSEPILKI